jgi:hypothetical protein
MKNKIIKKVLLIIVILTLLVSCKSKNDYVDISEIKYFRFAQTNGFYPLGDMVYEINYQDGKYISSIKPSNIEREDALIIEVSDEVIDKMKNIMKKYHIEKWNGFKEYDENVLDGSDFDLHVKFMNNTEIDAEGYMMWPNNYNGFRDEISIMFDEIYESNK